MRIPDPILYELPEKVFGVLEGKEFESLEDLLSLLDELELPAQELESLKEDLYELFPEATRLVKVCRWL